MKRNHPSNSDKCPAEEMQRVVLSSRDYEEALIHLHLEKERRTSYLWTQRDGTLIPVCSMDWNHLCNTIAMLERKKERIHLSELLAGEVL